jgi:hypothetical protein
VKTKWGVPHEQRDLTVAHSIMRKVVTDIYSDGADQTLTLDERQPAPVN